MNRRTISRWASKAAAIGTSTLAFLLTITAAAYAAPADPTARLTTIIGNITAWVVGILVAVATLFLTVGGLRYMFAGGDPSEVERAKGAFKAALIGYALAVLAPILLAVVKGWIGG